MSLWLFWTIAAVLFLGAVVLFYWGLWGDRSKGRLRCPSCWYRMEGNWLAGVLTCPECGHDSQSEKRLKKNHRRWWAIAPGSFILLVYLVVGSSAFSIWYGWRQEQKAFAAIKEADNLQHLSKLGNQFRSVVPEHWQEWVPLSENEYCLRIASFGPWHGPRSDRGLAHVANLTYLEVLVLMGDKVTDDGLIHLKSLKRLDQLHLSNTSVTDSGLVHLKELTNLKTIVLDETEVSDGGMVHLKEIPNLKDINLRGTQVTDAGLKHLKELKNLESLYLGYTRVTDQGLAELRKALPDCYID